MTDRRLGYIALCLIFLSILAVIGYGIYLSFYPAHYRIIAFSNLGTLGVEDPVFVRGVEAGKVVRVFRKKEASLAYVQIQTYSPLTIHADYHIDNSEIGFMGERIISIICGTPQFSEMSAADTLTGVFNPGISEAVGLAWKLEDLVDRVTRGVRSLRGDSSGNASFIQRFGTVITTIDSATIALSAVMTQGAVSIPAWLDTVEQVTASAGRILRNTATQLPDHIGTAQRLVVRIDTLSRSLDTFLQTVDDYARTGVRIDEELWPHLLRVRDGLGDFHRTLNQIRTKGFPLNTRILY